MIGAWIDGKPLYQKTIDCGAMPNKTNKNVAHGISNLKMCVGMDGFMFSASYGAPNTSIPIPDPALNQGLAQNTRVTVNATYVVLTTDIDRSALTGYVTIRYTKTTD